MPAQLDRPSEKFETRLYAADLAFLREWAARRSMKPTKIIRDLVATFVKVKRAEMVAGAKNERAASPPS